VLHAKLATNTTGPPQLAHSSSTAHSLTASITHPQALTITASQGGSGAIDMNTQWKKGRNDGPMGLGWKIICALLYFFPLQEIGAYGHLFIEKFPLYAWIDQLTGARHWLPATAPARCCTPHASTARQLHL
jgi:hypothetical protein